MLLIGQVSQAISWHFFLHFGHTSNPSWNFITLISKHIQNLTAFVTPTRLPHFWPFDTRSLPASTLAYLYSGLKSSQSNSPHKWNLATTLQWLPIFSPSPIHTFSICPYLPIWFDVCYSPLIHWGLLAYQGILSMDLTWGPHGVSSLCLGNLLPVVLTTFYAPSWKSGLKCHLPSENISNCPRHS